MPTKDLSAYLFLGEEEFLKEEAIDKLKSQFLRIETMDLNYSVFYAKDKRFDIKQMLGDLKILPFLSPKRLVILKDADSLSSSQKQSVIFYLNNPKDTSIFVMENPTPFIKGRFLLEVSKLAHLVYYRRLTDSGIDNWLVKRAALSGKKISPDAIRAIKDIVSNDLRKFASNMDKIILYVGKRDSITRQDVDRVTGVSRSHTAFDLIDSIEKKDAKSLLRIFSTLKKGNKNETELLGLLSWNVRMIFRLKKIPDIKNRIEMSKMLGLNPRMFDRIKRQASRFKESEILNLLRQIIRADVDIKSGIPPTGVMEGLIVKMCGQAD